MSFEWSQKLPRAQLSGASSQRGARQWAEQSAAGGRRRSTAMRERLLVGVLDGRMRRRHLLWVLGFAAAACFLLYPILFTAFSLLSSSDEVGYAHGRQSSSKCLNAPCFPVGLLAKSDNSKGQQIKEGRRKPFSDMVPWNTYKKTNIFFLKTHKCGSSTVQNILMRFGVTRGLNFVLPEERNYVGNPEPFDPQLHIGNTLRTPDGKYNIFTHHTRYNTSGVRKVMYSDAKYVTIVREPACLFESLFSYYKLTSHFGAPLRSLLATKFLNGHYNQARFAGKIGINQMAWDMGMNTTEFTDPDAISELIQKIDEEFDLVMVMEYMEVSLILLSEVMSWELQDVAFLTLNFRSTSDVNRLTEGDRQQLRELNNVDTQIYAHFLSRFRDRIVRYGVDRMISDVMKLTEMNSALYRRCVKGTSKDKSSSVVTYVASEDIEECKFAAMPELKLTQELRESQQARLSAVAELQRLMGLEL